MQIALDKIKISQSLIKAFVSLHDPFAKDFINPKCGLAFYRRYILREKGQEEPSDALLKGFLFEDVLIGGTRDGEDILSMIPRVGVKDRRPSKSTTKKVKIDYLKAKGRDEDLLSDFSTKELQEIIDNMPEDLTEGHLPKPFQDVRDMAKKHKGEPALGEPSIFDKLDIVIDQVQPEIAHEINGVTFEGHLDLFALYKSKPAIIDVKYTDTQEDDRFRGWGEPEEMDHTQALFYVWLWYKMTGQRVPFYYLVFGASGWIKFLEVDISEESLEMFEVQLEGFLTQLDGFEPKACGKFNVCQKCPFLNDCESAQLIPELEIIEAR